MTTDVGVVEIIISSDSMSAWGRIHPEADVSQLDEGKILGMLSGQSIELTDEVRDRVRLLVEQLEDGQLPSGDVVLAEGVRPVPGEDARIEWAPDCDPDRDRGTADGATVDGEVDHYARSNIISVSEGDLVCTIVPATEGTPGKDIYGREVPPRKGRRPPVQFSESIIREEGGNRMLARNSGRLNVVGRHAWISPLLTINHNVDFQSGNVDFDGDVLVRGSVLDLFSVKCSRDLHVKGMIEGACVECAGSVVVDGGIAGKQKAELTVAGDVRARFLDNARLTARGNVEVAREMVNSTVIASGLVATQGAITGCTIESAMGVDAAVIGSQSGVVTRLSVGHDRNISRRIGQIERELDELESTLQQNRARLEPMLQRQHALPDSRKQHLVQLLTQVKSDMQQIEELKQEKEQLAEQLKSLRGAVVKVARLIHDGTTVQIGKAVTTLRQSLRGPLKLVAHRTADGEQIAASSTDGSLVVLETTNTK